MKDLRRSMFAGFALAFALYAGPARAQTDDPADPLGLRASCARSTEAAPQDPAAWLDPDQIAADAQEFLRRSIAATVLVGIMLCSETGDDCHFSATAGTGTAVSADGLVLTAFHVIKDATQIMVNFRTIDDNGRHDTTGVVRRAKVVAVAPDKDVALLRLEPNPDRKPYPHLALECRWQADKRAPVWHFGQRSVWRFGRVTFTTTSSADIAGVYETDAKAEFGDSGGPFVRSTGVMIGILLSKKGDDRSYYMPVADAIVALEKAASAK